MSKKVLIFMVAFSLILITASLYIINTMDQLEKPKPVAEIITNISSEIKINDQFKLKFTDGKDFTFANLQNKFTVLYFGFSYCPDVCPIMLRHMLRTADLLGAINLLKVQFIFVSVDPARDTPETLAKFTKENGGDVVKAVTGSEEEINKLTLSLKAYHAKIDNKDEKQENYYVDHSAFIYFINPKAELISQFSPKALPQDMAEEIKYKIAEYK